MDGPKHAMNDHGGFDILVFHSYLQTGKTM